MLVLIGVAIVVIGFALRFNALLVVTVAGLATGLAGGMDLVGIISAIGKAFTENRYMGLIWLTLPVIALLERNGLKEQARQMIGRVRAATAGRVLMLYFVIRQVTAALGLTSLGGHAQMVRPLIAPMAEAAAANRHGELPDAERQQIRANASAVDNIAVFFGEDIFIAIQSILLIKGFLEQNGIIVEPLQVSVWAIPTAIAALLIHCTRLSLFDRRLARTFAMPVKKDAR
ncbi:DUF969 domain-containing protein [Dyella amyloliquefaciens]|uniref:DUF969 domain-containing protein n=1 Tax=Dyella amyloliquefaciens TaxID=1770545 RepID=UPI00102E69ED|nr:DUF969 domain-containing protein [Dyella amyloliquefaciens]